MASWQEIGESTIPEVNALLTGYKWDTLNLTFSFPDSGWWYVLEQVRNELGFFDIFDVLASWVSDPVGNLIDTLVDAVLGPFGDTAIIALVSLNGFQQFNAAEQAAAEFALRNVSEFTNLTFNEVDEGDFFIDLDPIFDGDGLDFGFTHGVIRFAETGSTSAPAFGIPPLERVEVLLGNGFLGDTWFDNDGRFDNATLGDYAFSTIMHELGHALGLKHGHEDGLFGTNIPDWLAEALTDVDGPILPPEHNSLEFSVMTYRSALGGPDSLQADNDSYPQTYMMYDILTLQYMYGANYGTRSGNTVYSWNKDTGQLTIDGAPQTAPGTNKVFLTIWDGGGTDTYDLSGYDTDMTISLAPGLWSKISDAQIADLGVANAQGNIYNALLFNGNTQSMIENAIGGSGGDTITGNELANALQGNGGADSLSGLAGNDTLDGGDGNDTLDGGADADTLLGGANDDLLLGGDGDDSIEGGTGNDTARGGAGFATINGGDGNDSIESGDLDDLLSGGAGNDTVLAGGGADIIAGNSGDDSILAGGGADVVVGGSGNDTIDGGESDDILNGDPGDDSITGGLGNDSIEGGDDNDALIGDAGADTLNGGQGNDLLDGGEDADRLVAGSGADTVFGGGGGDLILGEDGSDSILAGGGADTVDAGAGDDTVSGGGEADSIVGGTGFDSLTGDAGDDVIDAGADADTVDGGEGADTIIGAAGADWLSGGDGADSISAGSEADTVSGGEGNDTVLAGAGADLVAGDGGDDLIHGADGADTLRGGLGNDVMFGEAESDHLLGEDGNDTLAGGSSADTLDGGAGIDMASYIDATGPVVINLQDPAQTTGDAAGDLLISIEQFGLSNFDDTFIGLDDPLVPDVVYGRDGNDTLLGFAGADSLFGEGGDDSIVGGEGPDLLDGGAGTDTTSFLESNIGIVVDLVNPLRNTGIAAGDQIISVERFHMTLQNDEFVGLSAAETIWGYHGNDTVFGNGGDDVVYGGEQHDLLSGGAGGDTLLGEGGNDTLQGGAGDDSLLGGVDLDSLLGGAGADTLRGGAGDDRLTGGAGDDRMWGDGGRDIFAYAASGWGADWIFDFEDRTDRIEFTGLPGGPGIQAMNGLAISDRMGGSGIETVIRLAAGGPDEIVLVGIAATQINHQDFIFYSA